MKHFAIIACSLMIVSTTHGSSISDSSHKRVDNRVLLDLTNPIPRMIHAQGKVKYKILPRASGTTNVVIELNRLASPGDLQALFKAGAKLKMVDGKTIFFRSFVPAQIDRRSLDMLLELSFVSHISSAPQRGPLPLESSAKHMGLDGAWGSNPSLDLLTGKGVKVINVDISADIFHPMFFRSDGGYFDWIDMNEDGIFTPGVDAIDMNNDDDSANETGELLAAITVFATSGNQIDAHVDGFDPGVDWIYIDTNKNGERDYGAINGFDDSAPAFGEPLFVPDDVNQNGTIDLGERMVLLKTSKIFKVFITDAHPNVETSHVYKRGVDLAEFEPNISDQENVSYSHGHGTGVLSIIAGDNPLVGRRNVGVAPDVDLMLALSYETTEALAWALSEEVDVMLWEMANWYDDPLDGTDILSRMIDDTSVDSNVTHTCPVGNCGDNRKHVHLEIETNGTASLNLEFLPFGKYYLSGISINDSGPGNLSMTLTSPEGDTIDILDKADHGNLPNNGALFWVIYEKTSKDTRFHNIILYDKNFEGTILKGVWTLDITEQGVGDVILDGYLEDKMSGWNVGFAWDENVASNDRTIGIPAVSNSCIGVGAHADHYGTKTEPWFGPAENGDEISIRDYSSRGPTIDGRQKPDILAPDNPWVAYPHGQVGDSFVSHGAVSVFGGTSGSGPHVTGVAALLAQIGIYNEDAKQAIIDGAHVDDTVGDVPNYDYGWGRLNAAGALGVNSEGEPPTVTVSVPKDNIVGQPIIIQVNVDDADSSADLLEIKWDDDYDGTWDLDYANVENREISFEELGKYLLKVRVRDETGRFAEAIASINVSLETSTTVDASVTTNKDSDSGCGCEIAGKPTLSFFEILSLIIFS